MTIRVLCWLLAAAWFTAIGCRREEQIESYNVPKPAVRPTAPASASSSAEATDRMLAAVLPEGDRAWFFKVAGPTALVDSLAEPVNEFFAGVRPAAGGPHPKWQLPTGWQEQAGAGMRAATIVIPTSGKPLELSVTALPWSGAPGELLGNVNRWRGQLQLAPTDATGLASCTQEMKAGDATLTIVDLSGTLQIGGMMPPFAAGPTSGAVPPVAVPAAGSDASALPLGHPPIANQAPAGQAPFTYETPPGWESIPVSGMRKAAFRVTDGGKEALLTVIDFPADAGPMMADLLANVRRWRGEVGLPELPDAELKTTMSPIEIDGLAAQLVNATPSETDAAESQIERGTLAAMLTRAGTIWFFKLTGDRDLVAAQRDRFESFLKSVRFAGSGANDGHQ
jgi:hypothetical protein